MDIGFKVVRGQTRVHEVDNLCHRQDYEVNNRRTKTRDKMDIVLLSRGRLSRRCRNLPMPHKTRITGKDKYTQQHQSTTRTKDKKIQGDGNTSEKSDIDVYC